MMRSGGRQNEFNIWRRNKFCESFTVDSDFSKFPMMIAVEPVRRRKPLIR